MEAFIRSSMYDIPLIGKFLKLTQLLANITQQLISIQGTLLKLQKKSHGTPLAAIVAAIAAVAAAITAVGAATVVPEPVTKTALIVGAIAAIGLAFLAIKHIFDVMETNDEMEQCEDELVELRRKQDDLVSFLEEIKEQFTFAS